MGIWDPHHEIKCLMEQARHAFQLLALLVEIAIGLCTSSPNNFRRSNTNGAAYLFLVLNNINQIQ